MNFNERYSLCGTSSSNAYLKIRSIIMLLIYAAAMAIGIRLLFVPVAEISGVGIGNSIDIFVDSINRLFEKEEVLSESGMYLRGFLLPIVLFWCASILFPIAMLLVNIVCLVEGKDDIADKEGTWGGVIGSIIAGIVAWGGYCYYVSFLAEYYALSRVLFYALPLFIIPEWIVSVFNFLYLEKEEATTIQPSKAKDFFGTAMALLVIVAILFSLHLPASYNLLRRYSHLDTELKGAEKLQSYVGIWAAELNEYYGYTIDDSARPFSITPETPSVWTENGNNYMYYEAKIKELKAERDALTPASTTEKAMREYKEAVARKDEEIRAFSMARTKLPLNKTTVTIERAVADPYGYILTDTYEYETSERTPDSYDFARVRQISYNANPDYADEAGHKWSIEEDPGLSGLFHAEKATVQLVESRPVVKKSTNGYGYSVTTLSAEYNDTLMFTTKTDFSLFNQIRATVCYKDGSFRISFIRPKNYEELNRASAGVHTIKWEDDWGEYSAQIYIDDAE